MTAFIAFIVANTGMLLATAYAILNFLVAVTQKNEKVSGIFAVIRGFVERFVVVQPANAEGTIKVPGRAAGPKVEPAPIFTA